MQTGPLGPRWNRITENAENCDVCFNCFLQGSLTPKKKWKTENSSPSLTWLWSEVLSAGKPEVTALRPRAVRTGNCSGPSKEAGAVTASIRDIWSVAGLATGRWLVILLWGLGQCVLSAPWRLWGVRDTSARKRVRNSCQARWHLPVCPYPKQCISSKPASSLPFPSQPIGDLYLY